MSYRALYKYRSSEPNALCFEEGDRFTLLDSSVDPHWWQVADVQGHVGFVPANYIEEVRGDKLDDVISSIDRAIEFIHLSGTEKGGTFTSEQRKTLQKLIEHRQTVLNTWQTKSADSSAKKQPPTRSTSRSSGKHRSAPPPPMRAGNAKPASTSPPATGPSQTAPPNGRVSLPASDSSDSERGHTKHEETVGSAIKVSSPVRSPSSPVPDKLGEELVEVVRVETGLSFTKCTMALSAAFSRVRDAVPSIAGPMDELLQSLQQMSNSSVSDGRVTLEGSKDKERLEVIFAELTDCKNDSQQRSWALHEDEAVITEYLEELIAILSDANPDVCKAVIQKDNYEIINSLVSYYQMEHRTSLRLLLLKTFGVLCGLESAILSQLLSSVLLVEIARDMQADANCLQKVYFSSLVATMLLSGGTPLPYTHYDQLNEEFVSYLLNNIEDPPPEDESEQVPDLFVNLVLAFNLHFTDRKANLVMKVLAERQTSRRFSEKIMILVNREVDPVRMFEYDPKPPNSLLKFLCDIFASADTSSLFYTNDMNVLIDIIVRQLTDRSPGDKLRTEYLSLIHSILKMAVYWENKHRLADLKRSLEKIAKEEEAESKPDKQILMDIRKECKFNFTITF
ncbi:NCK-interacting protein with SH3 domain-like [Acanthaster planci]|uniref:NCK-interacting protein with SH3 domain-like n=1 Tax=Acanthaster planci TaxID=133434 RepID=A0A8B7XMS4_ACAPL|nr:NCK-interacting protein with SH3 domain-like [Acanthaster planci]XP_022081463.1 NCK-interacting protein with SH3 domain-like [Acanthaster planci]XP_022081464.1 NCK-interacting protein with SH3 domain-like [Acanthaster planci]XP_022081465.1 NCK-interacting protein with SH3 domain-like [Acanthaster planci]